MILRIQARSPNDDPALFRFTFGGSYVAIAAEVTNERPVVDDSFEKAKTGVQVNSVGTIVEAQPKRTKPLKPVAERKTEMGVKKELPPISNSTVPSLVPVERATDKSKNEIVAVEESNQKGDVTVVEDIKEIPAKPIARPKRASSGKTSEKIRKPPEVVVAPDPDPLARIQLVIQLKDGRTVERPMSEILTFGVDKGIYTVITKGGKITKYSIFEVAKVTIQ